MKRTISSFLLLIFAIQSIFSDLALAQALPLPASNIVQLTAPFAPTVVRGIILHPDSPFQFDFIVESGDDHLTDDAFQKESMKLIKYFLTSLTIPENDMWVNLNPKEKDRIIPQEFGTTDMGRDMLAQDYMLKQLTASLMNPDDKLGKEFWQKVYDQAEVKFGTTDIPMDTLSKVWIVPDKAKVYVKGQSVYVVESHLKVMMEGDYLKSGQRSVISGQENQQLSTDHLALTT